MDTVTCGRITRCASGTDIVAFLIFSIEVKVVGGNDSVAIIIAGAHTEIVVVILISRRTGYYTL